MGLKSGRFLSKVVRLPVDAQFPGGVHNMLRVRVCAAHMGGFLGPKFSRQGSLFRQIFHKHGWVFRNWRKIVKNGWFSAKIHHKSGYNSNFRSLEEGTFLKTGRQTPVHPQVMYPPPRLNSLTDFSTTTLVEVIRSKSCTPR